MEDFITRIFDNLGYRFTGPLHLRIYFQPLIAGVLGVISGVRDAKCGWSPYFRTLIRYPEHRSEMIRDGWQSAGKVFIVAAVLDTIYQLIVQQFVYPVGVLITAFVLAIVPYVIVRGLVGRTVSLLTGREKPNSYAKNVVK